MFKEFLIKKMLQAQGVSGEQADQVLRLMSKNPELFQKIAAEIEARIKSGEDKQAAALAVMATYQTELQKLV